jgi:hypothetical protein
MEKHCEHVTKIEDDYLKREFEGSEILPAHIVQLNNPYKLFSHFLSQDFLIRIVLETCIYIHIVLKFSQTNQLQVQMKLKNS